MKIVSIETCPFSVPLKPDLIMVNSLGRHAISELVILAIRTEEGLVGFGEASGSPTWSGELQNATIEIIQNCLAPIVLGRDPRDITALSAAMDCAMQHNHFAKAAIEMALMDLVGRFLHVPINLLLGGLVHSGPIPLKFSIGAYPPSVAANVAENLAKTGFRAFKVKVGRDVSTDVARVEAVRSALGSECRIAVDANGGWTENDFSIARRSLERAGVNALEEPLRRGDFRGSARIRQQTSIPLVLDESIFTPEQALEAVRSDACDLISIYPGKNGGIRRSLQIANIAHAAGIDCVIGSNLEGSVGSAAMLQLAAAIPNLSSSVDHEIIGPLYHVCTLDPDMPKFTDGKAEIPSDPGLGVHLNFNSIQEFQYATNAG